jgi:hypothetical protein
VRLGKWAVVGALWAWLLLIGLTHLTDRSPYSYGWAIFEGWSSRIDGAVVNGDAQMVRTVTLFFYEGAPVLWPQAQNMRLPLHSFVSSLGIAFTHSYLIGTFIAGFFFAALFAFAGVSFADRFGVRRPVALMTLMIAFTLPIYVEYIGQPMQYVLGTMVNWLTFLSVVALDERDGRNPWIFGLATAIFTLNYDPYVWLAALVTYVVFVRRFARKRDYAFYAIAALLPTLVWSVWLREASNGTMTKELRRGFVAPVVYAWVGYVKHPLEHALLPFLATHVGLHTGFHQILAMVPWPIVTVAVYLLLRLRPHIERPWILVALLPCFFFLEQFAADGWDWELNPRRALPVALAALIAYGYVAQQTWESGRWRVTFAALLVLCGFLAFADTLLRQPVLAYLHTGQAIRQAPQEAIRVEHLRLDTNSMRTLQKDDPNVIWRDLGAARFDRTQLANFTFAQLFVLALLAGFLWLVARARLLPRWAPLAGIGVWLLSAVRFAHF